MSFPPRRTVSLRQSFATIVSSSLDMETLDYSRAESSGYWSAAIERKWAMISVFLDLEIEVGIEFAPAAWDAVTILAAHHMRLEFEREAVHVQDFVLRHLVGIMELPMVADVDRAARLQDARELLGGIDEELLRQLAQHL